MSEPESDGLTVWGIGTVRTMRVHWILREFGLDYETRPIGARTGETRTEAFTALNPKQKIPVLRDGSLVLSESAAIVFHLSRSFPPPPDFLVPADAEECARHDEWCFFVMTELDAHSLYVIRRHDHLRDIYGAAPAAVDAAKAYFLKQLGAVAPAIAEGGPYLMGDRLSVADILMMTCADWANLYGIALPEPVSLYRERVGARPKYQEALRVNFPDLSAEAT
jgi:glutathione S-transferase